MATACTASTCLDKNNLFKETRDLILSCVIEKIKCRVMYQNYDKGGTHIPWVK